MKYIKTFEEKDIIEFIMFTIDNSDKIFKYIQKLEDNNVDYEIYYDNYYDIFIYMYNVDDSDVATGTLISSYETRNETHIKLRQNQYDKITKAELEFRISTKKYNL